VTARRALPCRIPALPAAAGLLLAMAGPGWAQAPAVGAPAPAVALRDLDSVVVDLGEIYGKKPVVVLFWATWCPICEKLIPQLDSARARFGDRVALFGVNVTVNEDKERVRRHLAAHPAPFRTLWDDQGESVRAFDVLGTSVVVIIDAEGRLAYAGYGEGQDLVGEIAKVVR